MKKVQTKFIHLLYQRSYNVLKKNPTPYTSQIWRCSKYSSCSSWLRVWRKGEWVQKATKTKLRCITIKSTSRKKLEKLYSSPKIGKILRVRNFPIFRHFKNANSPSLPLLLFFLNNFLFINRLSYFYNHTPNEFYA